MERDMRTEALQYLKKTFALATKSGNKEKLAWCYMNSGQYNNAINNYVVALDDLMEALRLYRELKHTKGEAATLMNLGIAYFTMKDYERALNYFHQSYCVIPVLMINSITPVVGLCAIILLLLHSYRERLIAIHREKTALILYQPMVMITHSLFQLTISLYYLFY